jgi:alkane 1-monooxygenase
MCFVLCIPWVFVLVLTLGVPIADALIGREATGSVADGYSAEVPSVFLIEWGCALAVALVRVRASRGFELVGVVAGMGLLSAMAVAHGHELMHRKSRTAKLLADLAFVCAGYPHYRLGHQLHHANLGNPEFGSAAPLGCSVWAHVFQSTLASAKSTIRVESMRARNGARNRFSVLYGGELLFLSIAAWYGGWKEVLTLVACAVLTIFVVEVIGYIQHYGITIEDGSRRHLIAWTMPFWLSNRLFANNGYHKDHHLHQRRPYWALQSSNPCLPAGYVQLMWLAFLPMRWHRLMNELLEEEIDLTGRGGNAHPLKNESP